jgi:hypothetical protein
MAQVALAWLRHRSVPVIPIIGARKLPQLQDNLASLELSFTADQLKSLDEASRIELGFPQELFTRELPRSLRSGGMADGSSPKGQRFEGEPIELVYLNSNSH